MISVENLDNEESSDTVRPSSFNKNQGSEVFQFLFLFQIFKIKPENSILVIFQLQIDIFGQKNLPGSNEHTNKQIKNIKNVFMVNINQNFQDPCLYMTSN